MMDPFLAQMIARKEHELLMKSIAAVSEEEAVCGSFRSKTCRTSHGETKAVLPMIIARPKVHIPRKAPMPRWIPTAIAKTMGRVSRGQTRTQ